MTRRFRPAGALARGLTLDSEYTIVPRFSTEQARELALRHYRLRAAARDLPSYVDQNFRLTDEAGAEFVLKIANSEEDPALLHAQVACLEWLQERPGLLDTPRVVPCTEGGFLAREGGHAVWLVTALPGRTLAQVGAAPRDLPHGLGLALGDLDVRLLRYDHSAVHRSYEWDLREAPRALALTPCIADPSGRDLVRSGLERFAARILPAVDELPFQVVHNDPNDHNLLVQGEGAAARVTGLVDFGDMVWTARVCEPAIAMTYVMMPADAPLDAGASLLAGYHARVPLTRAEIGVVPDLIEARLCVSVTMSAYRGEREPDNAYVAVSEGPAWRLLEWIAATPRSRWTEALEEACAEVRPIGDHDSWERAGHES